MKEYLSLSLDNILAVGLVAAQDKKAKVVVHIGFDWIATDFVTGIAALVVEHCEEVVFVEHQDSLVDLYTVDFLVGIEIDVDYIVVEQDIVAGPCDIDKMYIGV